MAEVSERQSPDAGTMDRKNLLDVLMFLERRGTAPEVIALAMRRAGIQADVARLLSRCPVATQVPQERPAAADDRIGIAAERALRGTLRLLATWLLVFGSALLVGLAFGYELGAAAGFEAGMDRLVAMLNGS